MAENVRSDIIINVDTSIGIAEIKNLQRQISALNAQLISSGAAQAKSAQNVQKNLINNINSTGQFAASIRNISSTAENFTSRLERNKLGMGEYFRFAGGASQTFGRLFKSEFDTIEKVARERVKTIQTQFVKLGRTANGTLQAIAVRPLSLDMENLATKTAMAAQKQQLMNQLLKQGSTNLLNFGKNTQWAGRQLMVGFTLPLAFLGQAAAKTFMQMEEQAIRFKRVYGDTFTATSETDKMIEQVKALASEFTKYGVSAEKTMEMAANAAAMGKVGSDLLAQIAQATRLSVLGGVEQDKALETTISLTNAFGIATEELANKINFLNAVENQTVVSIEDLTIAIPKAGPVVEQLGGSVEDLAFLLTAMKEGGINASEGANALKSGLAALINPTGKAAEMVKGLGININGIVEGNVGDVKGMVIDFATALDTLDPLSRARAIEQLFGKFQFARLSTLFKNVIGEGTQAERVLKLSSASAAELAILSERELKRVEDSPMFKFKKAVEDLQVALAPLGEAFLKAVTPIVNFVKGFLDRFNELDSGAKQFIVTTTAVLAGLGPVLLMAFGLVANGAANLIKLFSGLGRVFFGIGGASQTLGSQTEYMVQQQLEAASVAASLDQKHSKLIQTFTSEAGAVDRLAQAYGRAIVAQSRLAGIPIGGVSPGRAKAPKKFASGVVSVPGPKGAGDIVPAMLSPGEAVIPAKMASRYSGLISGMVSGDIPGYENGREGGSRRRNLQLPNSFGLQASHMSEGTKTLTPQTARAQMNRELDKLIRQGVVKESMVDRSLISRISQDVKLNSQTVGLLTGRFNQWFTSEKSVKDLSSIVRELSRTKGMVGASTLPNLDYLVKNDMAQTVQDSTKKKYLKDLDRQFRTMVANSSIPNLSEKQIQAIFKKAQISAESKIANLGEKNSIKKANILGRSNLSPAAPGSGQTGRTNLRGPLQNFGDIQKVTRERYRPEVARLSGVADKWLSQNSKFITSTDSQTGKLKNLLKTLPEADAKALSKAIIGSNGSPEALDEILKKAAAGKKIDVSSENKAKPNTAAKPENKKKPEPKQIPKSKTLNNQSVNLSNILNSGTQSSPRVPARGRAGLIAKLFGRKYANGVLSVPGPKGAGDVVPAMLSPGEAVIPTKQSKKYAGLIQGMMDDSIPGFRLGRNPFAFMLKNSRVATRMKSDDLKTMLKNKDFQYKSGFDTETGADFTKFRGSQSNPAGKSARMKMEADVMGIPEDAPNSARPTYGSVAPTSFGRFMNKFMGLKGKQFNEVADPRRNTLDLYGDVSLIGKKSMNKKTTIYGGDSLNDHRRSNGAYSYQRKQEGLSPDFNMLPKMLGSSPGDLERQLRRMRFPFGKGIQSKTNPNQFSSNPGMSFIEAHQMGGFNLKEVSKMIAPNRKMAKELQQVVNQAGLKIRVTPDNAPGVVKLLSNVFGTRFSQGSRSVPPIKAAGAPSAKVSSFASGVVSVPGPKGAGDVVPAMLSPGEAVIPTSMARKYSPLINAMISDSIPGYNGGLFPPKVSDGPNLNNQSKPPKNTGLPANLGGQIPVAKPDLNAAKVSGKATGDALAKSKGFANRLSGGLKVAAEKTATSVANKVKDGLTVATVKTLGSASGGFSPMSKGRVIDNDTKRIYNSEAELQAAYQNPEGIKHLDAAKQDAARAKEPGRISQTGNQFYEANAEGKKVQMKGPAGREALARQQLKDEQGARRAPKERGRGARRAAGVAGVASMAAMAYGMSGGAGADIAGQLTMPLMGLSMVLPLLKTPLGFVVAGLAAIAGAAVFFHIKAKEATKSGLALGEAMSMTGKKLEGISALTGTVTSSQEASRIREDTLSGESAKKRFFGQNFMESEAGISLLADAEAMTQAGQSNREIAENFSSQLSYAVLQGAVTQEQAASIAAGLGEKLQDYSITANIIGTLTGLFGKDGQNLIEDPLKVSLAIQDQAAKRQSLAFESSQVAIDDNSKNNANSTGFAAAAAAMAVAGLALAPATAGISAVVGSIAAGVTALTGATVTYFTELGDTEENNKAQGVSVQLGAEQIAQNQGLLDSLSDRFGTEIAILEAKKKAAKTDKEKLAVEAEINSKILQRDTSIKLQKEQNDKIFQGLLGQASVMGSGFTDAIGLSIEERFKDASGAMKAAATLAKDALAELPNKVDGELNVFKTSLQVGLASGEFDPITVANLVNASSSDPAIEKRFSLLVSSQGTADANAVLQLMNKAGVTSENYSVVLDLMAKDPTSFKENSEALAQIANMPQEYGISVDLNVDGDKKVKAVGDFIKDIDDLPEQVTKKVLTQYIANHPGMKPETKKTLEDQLANWDVLSGGDNTVAYQVIVDYKIGEANDAAIFAAFLANNPGISQLPQHLQAGYMSQARSEFFAETPDPAGDDTGDDTGKGNPTGTGAARSEVLDDLLKKLQNVRQAAVNATGGIKELMRLLGSGLNFTGFTGIEQQLSLKGYTQDFIDFMSSADKATQDRFMTNKAGIVTLKEEGKALQNLFAAVTLGNFQRSVQAAVTESKNEVSARKELLKVQGLSYDQVIEASRNSGLAEAISAVKASTAIKNKSKAIKETIQEYQKLFEITARDKRVDFERSLKNSIEASGKEVMLRNTLIRLGGMAYEDVVSASRDAGLAEQVSSIRTDKTILNKNKRIKDTIALYKKEQAALESARTPQEQFAAAFDARMALIGTQEAKINIEFEIGTDSFEDIVRTSQAEIDLLVNQAGGLDDLQAGLTQIAWQEEDINKKYDSRIDALEKVESANQRISEQQKTQLTLADALSQGDLASAAKAIQELRAQDAKNSLQSQRKLIEQSRTGELEGLSATVNGVKKTRKTIEEEILVIEKNIHKVEEERLETSKESIRVASLARDIKLDALDGEKLRWQLLKADIDLAAAAASKYLITLAQADAMARSALSLISATENNSGSEFLMRNSALAKANPEYFSQVLSASQQGTSNASQVIDFVNAVNQTRRSPRGMVAMARGGMVPKYFKAGGFAVGSDTVPAMLTPGEFVVKKYAVENFGVDKLKSINNGTYDGDSVYNYSLSVNMSGSNLNADDVARSVMSQIKQVDSQRIRGNRL